MRLVVSVYYWKRGRMWTPRTMTGGPPSTQLPTGGRRRPANYWWSTCVTCSSRIMLYVNIHSQELVYTPSLTLTFSRTYIGSEIISFEKWLSRFFFLNYIYICKIIESLHIEDYLLLSISYEKYYWQTQITPKLFSFNTDFVHRFCI